MDDALPAVLPGPDLTVAVCTKDRPDSLRATVEGIASDVLASGLTVEIIVVDDASAGIDVRDIRETCEGRGATLEYVLKSGKDGGLYESRRLCVRIAKAPLVVFLDDDVEIGRGYLRGVLDAFQAWDVVGVGGVDSSSLPARCGPLARAYMRLFSLKGPGPGDLSRTGLNYSQASWRSMTKPFDSQFLHGCNMAFRKEALQGLPRIEWLAGHAPTEDLVLSHFAGGSGRLTVDPNLPIRHLPAPGGRGVGAGRIANKLLAMGAFSRMTGRFTSGSFLWSSLGMFIKDMANAKRTEGRVCVVRGYASGLIQVFFH